MCQRVLDCMRVPYRNRHREEASKVQFLVTWALLISLKGCLKDKTFTWGITVANKSANCTIYSVIPLCHPANGGCSHRSHDATSPLACIGQTRVSAYRRNKLPQIPGPFSLIIITEESPFAYSAFLTKHELFLLSWLILHRQLIIETNKRTLSGSRILQLLNRSRGGRRMKRHVQIETTSTYTTRTLSPTLTPMR